MSSSLAKPKNVMYRRKELGNGDVSDEVRKQLKQTRRSKALEAQLKKMGTSMSQFNKTMSKTYTKFDTTKLQKESQTFHQNLRKIARNQATLKEKLLSLNNSNRNYYYSKKMKLPSRIDEIDDDIDLTKLLLKNPTKMTEEEKAFIASFNKKEFAMFIEYLRMKDRELKWQGNGYGSGHYIEGFISIYRKCGDDDEKRSRDLKKFLKMNYTKSAVKEEETNALNWGEAEEVGDNCEAPMDETETECDDYEKTANALMKNLEDYKGIMNFEKTNADLEKFAKANELLEKQLEEERRQLREELERKQKEGENIDEKYAMYINDIKNKDNELDQDELIGDKIKEYMERMNLSGEDLAKRFIESDTFINLSKDYVIIERAEKRFVELKILKDNEAKRLCEILIKFNGDKIRGDIFADFLENQGQSSNVNNKKKKSKGQFEEEDTYEGDNAVNSENIFVNEDNDDEDFDYDGDRFKPKPPTNKTIQLLKKKLEEEYISKLNEILKKKNATFIQKHYKGHLTRRKVNSERIYIYILVKRICNLFRKNYENKRRQKEENAAKKITYLLRKNYWKEKDLKNLSSFSSRWLQGRKNISDNDRRNIAASVIQHHWRMYHSMSERDNQQRLLDIRVLKTKFCFVCKKHKVVYLCKECENNHFCESCFLKFHMRGAKRNHEYVTVEDVLRDEYKVKKEKYIDPEKIEKREKIKEYLRENNINLGEKILVWDFKNDKTITYKVLKDALSIKSTNISEKMQNEILDYALDFVINGTKKNKNDYIISMEFIYDLTD